MKMEKYLEPQYINQFLWMFFAIIVMGIGLSFMFIANMGTDPFSTMNRGIAMRASHLVRKLSADSAIFSSLFWCLSFSEIRSVREPL